MARRVWYRARSLWLLISLSGLVSSTFKQLVSGSNAVRLWDPATGALLQTLNTTDGASWINAVAYSPDGKRLASGWNDGAVRLWDLATGAVLLALNTTASYISAVAYSPNSKQLASGRNNSTGGVIMLWDPATGALT